MGPDSVLLIVAAIGFVVAALRVWQKSGFQIAISETRREKRISAIYLAAAIAGSICATVVV